MNVARLVLFAAMWHRCQMPVFLERFVLPSIAAAVVLLALSNPMGFDVTQRVAGTVILLLVALGTAIGLHRHNKNKKAGNEPVAAKAPVPTPIRTPKAPQLAGRIYVDVTPDYLRDHFKVHTSIQAAKLLDTYLGKWLRVTGKLQDVSSAPGNGVRVTFDRKIGAAMVSMRFSEEWHDRVDHLQRGSDLTIDGRIDEVNLLVVRLEDCELVDPSEPPGSAFRR